jgi:hypothetical protein
MVFFSIIGGIVFFFCDEGYFGNWLVLKNILLIGKVVDIIIIKLIHRYLYFYLIVF